LATGVWELVYVVETQKPSLLLLSTPIESQLVCITECSNGQFLRHSICVLAYA